MANYLKTAALILITFLPGYKSGAQKLPAGVVLRVVIIRHGEKSDSSSNLSCMGLNRSLALPAVLINITGKPDYTFVPAIKNGNITSSNRMFQTITPFAVKQNLIINTDYKEDDCTAAANDVLGRTGMVLMVWEHSNIPPLAKALGATGKLSWSGKDFDSMWILDFTSTKKGLKFKKLSIKQQGINPADTCP
jgi:hypothetical protein